MNDPVAEIEPGGTVHPTFMCCYGRFLAAGLNSGWRGESHG
jgi:hypothetical protein